MNSRERIKVAVNHRQPDKLPIDFGGMTSSMIHVSALYKLRQRLGLDKALTPVKVIEPYQMLGEIDQDLREIIGSDCVGILGKNNLFDFPNDGWKEWKLWDGTPLLVPELFNTEAEDDGNILMYPQGDKSVPPSAKMPNRGFWFDSIMRQDELDENDLNVEDNFEEFQLLPDGDLKYIKDKVDWYYYNTKYCLFASLVNSGLGDVALVPGPGLKYPKGIRNITEWYISLATRKDYIRKIFNRQAEVAIDNYKRLYKTIGNKIGIIMVSGADMAMQNGLIVSKELYNDLYKPFYLKINNWIHENTEWKSFVHSCGAIEPLIKDIISTRFDIINPVQISAKGMDPESLKKEYGKDITFWGGGVNTQKTFFWVSRPGKGRSEKIN